MQTQLTEMVDKMINGAFQPGVPFLVVIWFAAGWLLFPLVESWRKAYANLKPLQEYLADNPPATGSAPSPDANALGWSLFWRFLPFYGVAAWFAYARAWGEAPDVYRVVPIGAFLAGLGGYLILWALLGKLPRR